MLRVRCPARSRAARRPGCELGRDLSLLSPPRDAWCGPGFSRLCSRRHARLPGAGQHGVTEPPARTIRQLSRILHAPASAMLPIRDRRYSTTRPGQLRYAAERERLTPRCHRSGWRWRHHCHDVRASWDLRPVIGFDRWPARAYAAKPVIDMIAFVCDLDAPIAAMVSSAGYQFPRAFNATLIHRRFLCYPTASHRTYHFHLVDERERRLCFRDRLRADAVLAEEYVMLKRALAERYSERPRGIHRGQGNVRQTGRTVGSMFPTVTEPHPARFELATFRSGGAWVGAIGLGRIRVDAEDSSWRRISEVERFTVICGRFRRVLAGLPFGGSRHEHERACQGSGAHRTVGSRA